MANGFFLDANTTETFHRGTTDEQVPQVVLGNVDSHVGALVAVSRPGDSLVKPPVGADLKSRVNSPQSDIEAENRMKEHTKLDGGITARVVVQEGDEEQISIYPDYG